MRKQTKLVAVLSAAALLAIGASMTSFAAPAHWDQQDGEWVYLDRNGDPVTDEWKKSNGQWYYLDSDGYMAKDMFIEYGDNMYYVDPNGVKVTNTWVETDNDDYLVDDNNDDISTVWFYFDGKGKAVGYNANDEKTVKKLGYGDNQKGYFLFDTNGCMLSGWQLLEHEGEEYVYYLGDENQGWAATGWNKLDTDEEIHLKEDGEPYEEEEWFYFDSKGKAYADATKSIGGKWYTFSNRGVMETNWSWGTPGAPEVASRSYYDDVNGIGNREKNWTYAYLPQNTNSYWDDMYWFYLNNKGVAFNEHSEDFEEPDDVEETKDVAAKTIKNQTYLFGFRGRMLTGLWELDADVDREGGVDLTAGTYYFTESEDSTEGQMIKNKKATIDVDGDEQTFYFQKNGSAYVDRVVSGYVYGSDAWLDESDAKKTADGALLKNFGDGNTYQLIDAKTALTEKDGTKVCEVGDIIAINGNGKIKKGGTFTDVDGRKVKMSGYKVESVSYDKVPVDDTEWVK